MMSADEPFSATELATLGDSRLQVTGTPAVRFALHCIEYFRTWADASTDRRAAGKIKPGQSLVMVYAEAPEAVSGLPDAMMQNRRRVRRSVLTLEEGVAVCNENLQIMLQLAHPIGDANDAMEFVQAYLSDEHVFVVLLMDKNRMLVHPAGLDILAWLDDPEVVEISLADDAVTDDRIAEELGKFHVIHTSTPNARTARLMWNTSIDPVGMHHKPEQHVQTSLQGYLEGCFRGARTLVDEEVPNQGGRVDIRVQRFDRKQKSTSITTMLELKVLNPTHAQAVNYAWALSSLEQSDGYRQSDTDACFACIYDARRDQSDTMPDLEVHAKAANVRLERYPMAVPSPSANAAKKAKAANAPQSAGKPRKAATKKVAAK